MTEAEFQQTVIELCHWLHVSVYHTFDSRRSEPGFPDLVICGPRGILFRELKTEVGRVTAGQKKWLNELRTAGGNVAVWRPRHLPTIKDEILAACGRWPT